MAKIPDFSKALGKLRDVPLQEATAKPSATSPSSQSRHLTVKLPPEILRQFRICLSAEGTSARQVLQDLVTEWIRQHPPRV